LLEVDVSWCLRFTLDVRPFTVYKFAVVVCTAVGCTNSTAASITTPQHKPLGLQLPYYLAYYMYNYCLK